MLRSLFLSITSLVVLSGCSDDACGPGTAGDTLTVTTGAGDLTYSGLVSGQNNDCPDASAPSGVVSLTIEGTQQGGTGRITLCIPRPDQLAKGTLALGTTAARIIDLNGDSGGCTFAFDAANPVTGTVGSTGLCENGADPAGYALVVDGTLTMTKTCSAMVESVSATIAGTTAVALRML